MILRPKSYATSFARECRERARSSVTPETRRRYESLAADYERLGARQPA